MPQVSQAFERVGYFAMTPEDAGKTKPQKPALHGSEGKTFDTSGIAGRVEHHAACIVSAMGFLFDAYEASQRRAILSSVLNAYEEAYRAGADFAAARLTQGNEHG